MPIRVLVVDDSGFFRRRLTEILNADPQIEVVEVAVDGKDAIAKAKACKPDVITMDIEMPVMNGIDSTRQIMQEVPTPVLMFSSLTYDGAQATLDALEAGATDFLPKRFGDISSNKEEAQKILCDRVKLLASQKSAFQRTTPARPAPGVRQAVATDAAKTAAPTRLSKRFSPVNYDLIAIGTSTGGPVALQNVLIQLPASFSLPILIVQHMPAKFTEAFANRLDQLCKIKVCEAQDQDVLEPGVALLAPGGMQMVVEVKAGRKIVRVKEETDPLQNYKPCVDVMFNSLVDSVGKRVLGIILTGMGADGKIGSSKLISKGAVIWAQDEDTSTIYGMPAAVAGIAEQILPLDEIGKKLALNS